MRAVIQGDQKYVHGGRPEMYDLGADPDELRNLSAADPERARRLRRELEGFLKTHAGRDPSAAVEIDAETRERLEALGYLGAGGPRGGPIAEALLDGGTPPQDRVQDVSAMTRAKNFVLRGRAWTLCRWSAACWRWTPRTPSSSRSRPTPRRNWGSSTTRSRPSRGSAAPEGRAVPGGAPAPARLRAAPPGAARARAAAHPREPRAQASGRRLVPVVRAAAPGRPGGAQPGGPEAGAGARIRSTPPRWWTRV